MQHRYSAYLVEFLSRDAAKHLSTEVAEHLPSEAT